MRSLIYNILTFKVIRFYNTARGAKCALTRKHGGDPELAVASVDDFYDNIDKKVVVRSLMNGQAVKIRASEVGGPCDPSTERYWSM